MPNNAGPLTPTELYASVPVTNSSIRVLEFDKLELSPEGHVLGGELVVYSFAVASHLRLFALSYTWGREDSAQGIINIRGTQLKITTNGKDALVSLMRGYFREQFRDKHKEFRIWIDAVCINQADQIEKYTQLAVMGEIYTNVTVVYIWLGQGTKESDEAMQYISRVEKPCATQRCAFLLRDNPRQAARFERRSEGTYRQQALLR
jgi:hypothetical protein